MSIADMRQEYKQAALNEADAEPNPIRQFDKWFEQAVAVNTGEWFEPNAMTLATVTPDGQPTARVMLLKDFNDDGFTFYTNYDSQKGRELAANPRAALVFHWPALERQVRIEGTVDRLSHEESLVYHLTRPRGSQLGGLASQQSQVIPNRQVLEARLKQLEAELADKDVPLPAQWGGYLLRPRAIEFWQGRPDRLHDRLRYTRHSDGTWRIERLSP